MNSLQTVRILHGASQYGVFAAWQEALACAFRAMGIDAAVVSADDERPGRGKGELGLSFNLVRRWAAANCGNRHVAWLVDHPVYHAVFFMPELSGISRNDATCAVACVDEEWAQFARALYGFPHVFFAPHFCCALDCLPPHGERREYDVVCFGSIRDPDAFLSSLEHEAGPFWPVLRDAVAAYSNPCECGPLDQFLFRRLRSLSPDAKQVSIMMNAFFPFVDGYFRCLGRLRLFQSIRRTTVHVFGAGPWKHFPLPGNIVFHDPVPFSAVPGIMAGASVLLNHTPTLRAGAHERIFEALAAGCLVHTTTSSFLAGTFGEDAGLSFYNDADIEGMDDQLSALLGDSAADERIRAGQAIVATGHTARNRAEQIAQFHTRHWSSPVES